MKVARNIAMLAVLPLVGYWVGWLFGFWLGFFGALLGVL